MTNERSARSNESDPRGGANEQVVVTRVSPWSMADTAARLSAVVSARGMKVFAVIDDGDEARRVGLALRDTKLFIASSFAQDLTPDQQALITATQRPAALAGLGEPSGPPAWRDIPAWAVIGMQDRIVTPGSQRQMAEHANAQITEVDASHVSMVSHPDAIVEVILTAAAQVREAVTA